MDGINCGAESEPLRYQLAPQVDKIIEAAQRLDGCNDHIQSELDACLIENRSCLKEAIMRLYHAGNISCLVCRFLIRLFRLEAA